MIDIADRNTGQGRYISSEILLVHIIQLKEENVHTSLRRALHDAWNGWIFGIMGLSSNDRNTIFCPRTGRNFLITGKEAKGNMGITTSLKEEYMKVQVSLRCALEMRGQSCMYILVLTFLFNNTVMIP